MGRLTLFSFSMRMSQRREICGVCLWLCIHGKVVEGKRSCPRVARQIESLVPLTEVELRHMKCRESAK
jgi:hypothetical protein